MQGRFPQSYTRYFGSRIKTVGKVGKVRPCHGGLDFSYCGPLGLAIVTVSKRWQLKQNLESNDLELGRPIIAD